MSKSNKKTFNQNFLNRRSAYPSASSLGDGRGNSAAPQKSFAGNPHRPPDDVRAAAARGGAEAGGHPQPSPLPSLAPFLYVFDLKQPPKSGEGQAILEHWWAQLGLLPPDPTSCRPDPVAPGGKWVLPPPAVRRRDFAAADRRLPGPPPRCTGRASQGRSGPPSSVRPLARLQ